MFVTADTQTIFHTKYVGTVISPFTHFIHVLQTDGENAPYSIIITLGKVHHFT